MGKLTNSEKIEIMRIIKTAGRSSDDENEFRKWVELIEADNTPLTEYQGGPPRSE